MNEQQNRIQTFRVCPRVRAELVAKDGPVNRRNHHAAGAGI
jgi:hypothetical protein